MSSEPFQILEDEPECREGSDSSEDNESSFDLIEKFMVPVVFVVFVTMRAMDRIFNKRVTDRMRNYNVMYTNIFWPIGVQLMTYLMVGGYIYYQRYFRRDLRYDWRFFLPGATIASGVGAIPIWKFGVFSVWDQLNATLTNLPAPFIDICSQSILTNLGLVWTVLLSAMWLGTRYDQEHYIGCILVVLSGLIAVTVQIQTGDPPLGQYVTATGVFASSSAVWYIIYIIGTIPQGISNCYKQLLLKDTDLEVMYATLWSGNWQVLWGLLLFPLNWMPLPEPAPTTIPSETGEYLSRAWSCFMGTAPLSFNATTMQHFVTVGDQQCAASGGSAAVWFVVYLCFNISFNLLFLWLVKRMSATWATIATVLCLDLTSLLSMSEALEGSEARPLTFEQYLGLFCAGIAMWVYTLKEERDRHGNIVNGAHAQDDSYRIAAAASSSFTSDRVTANNFNFGARFTPKWKGNTINHSNQKSRIGGEVGRLTITF